MLPMLAFGQHHMMSVLASQQESLYPQYVGSSDIGDGSSTSETEINISIFDVTEGEFMVICAMATGAVTFTAPTGWSEFEDTQEAHSQMSVAFFYKTATSSEPTDVAIPFTPTVTGLYSGIIHRFSGVSSIPDQYDIPAITSANRIDLISYSTSSVDKLALIVGVLEDDATANSWGTSTKLVEVSSLTGTDVYFFAAARELPKGESLSASYISFPNYEYLTAKRFTITK